MSTYRPRGMPARFMKDAPREIRRAVIDIIRTDPPAPLDFDVVLRPGADDAEIAGVDFGKHGARGCHFFLKPHEMRAYRERNRRKRVAWAALPPAARAAILNYVNE